MSFFSKPTVAIGDRFAKIGNYATPIWKVSRISTDSNPAHARLEKEGAACETITVSVPALTDGTLFARLAP